MDLWKILILGVVAVGLLLILWTPPELPKLPQGRRVEEGTFRVLTESGAQEEIFGIYPVDVGFRLVGIRHEKGKILVEGDLLYGPDWTPIAGTITQRYPAEVRWLFAFAQDSVTIKKQVEAKEFAETIPLLGGAFPFDRDLLSVWDPLFRAGIAGEAQILDVRNGAIHKVDIGQKAEVKLNVLGRALPAERYSVTVDDEVLQIFRQGDLLLGVKSPKLEAFLLEILPEGIQETP
ncbi:MAG: hypothetical protein ACP5LJ_03490 [Candidatus Bipolaricaulaceae bacterium]